jgi:cellulose synthase operon protein C
VIHGLRIGALLALAAMVVGCSPHSAAEYMARAQQSMAKQDYRAAAIDLKNALQLEPENAAARVALGRAALEMGDFAAAERELRFARRLGRNDAEVQVLLARVLLAQHNYDALLKEVDTSSPADAPSRQQLLDYRGRALMMLGRAAEARKAFEEAVSLDPKSISPRIGLSNALMSLEGFDPAKAALDEARKLEPANVEVSIALGQLYAQNRQFPQAEATLSEAVALADKSANHLQLGIALASLSEVQMALNKVDVARQTTDRLAKLAPESPITLFLQARDAFLRGDNETAHSLLEQVLARDPRNTRAQLLLGAVNYAQGNLGQADMYLSSVVAAQPANSFARRLLAETRLRDRKPKDALAALQPAAAGDDELRALAGWAAVQAGDLDAGITYLKENVKAHPDDATAQLQLAAGYLGAGRTAQAISTLEAVPKEGNEAQRRDLLLINAHVRNHDFPKAIEVAEHALQAKPGDELMTAALASLLTTSGDYPRARSVLEHAATLDPKSPAPLLGLGRIDLMQGKPADAITRFQKALALKPANPAILTALAQAHLAAGHDEEGTKLLEQIARDNPTNVDARVMLGYVYLAQGKLDKSQSLAQQAVALAPSSPAALNLLASTLDAGGHLPESIKALEDASAKQPESAAYRFNLARSYLKAGRVDDALAAARECLKVDPNYVPALAMAGSLLLTSDPAESGKMLERIRVQAPDHPAVAVLEGDLAMREGQYAQAAQSYARAGRTAPAPELALREFAARFQGKLPDPDAPLTAWLASHPQDVRVRTVLAQSYETRGDTARAIAEYERVIGLDPKQPVALNNLAYLYMRQSDPRAEATAKRAYDAAPQVPNIADTYGWTLVKAGKFEQAEGILREASQQAPKAGEIQFHLAVALARTGKPAEAREVLSQALAQEGKFEGRDEAESLMRSLGQ